MQKLFVCDFFPVRKEALRSWRVGGIREQFLLNVLLRGSDKKKNRKERERSDIFLDGQVDQEEAGKI